MIKGLGIDMVEIERIERILKKNPRGFLKRILTEQEREYCLKFRNPAPEVAARFAAKEAFTKAIGTGITRGVSWKHIEVVKERGAPPRIRVQGKAREIANSLEVNNIHLSLTHTARYAAAVVTIEKS